VLLVDGIVNCVQLVKQFLVNLAFWVIWYQLSQLSLY